VAKIKKTRLTKQLLQAVNLFETIFILIMTERLFLVLDGKKIALAFFMKKYKQ
jgi:hypothetical protein